MILAIFSSVKTFLRSIILSLGVRLGSCSNRFLFLRFFLDGPVIRRLEVALDVRRFDSVHPNEDDQEQLQGLELWVGRILAVM